jgi:hypothetical protein
MDVFIVVHPKGSAEGHSGSESALGFPGGHTMKRLFALTACALTLCTAACFGQEEREKWEKQEKKARRLESLTWDPIQHRLHWVVSKGTLASGGYKAAERHEYDINMDQATMTFSEETRRFSEDEAESVGALLDLIAQYAAESTVWWEQGHGVPLNKKAMPVSSPKERLVEPPMKATPLRTVASR